MKLYVRNHEKKGLFSFIGKGDLFFFVTIALSFSPINHELYDNIKNVKLDMTTKLKEKGIKLISDSAFELFMNGMTSVEEIYPLLLIH